MNSRRQPCGCSRPIVRQEGPARVGDALSPGYFHQVHQVLLFSRGKLGAINGVCLDVVWAVLWKLLCVRGDQGEGLNLQVRHKMLCSQGSPFPCLSSSQRMPVLLSRCAAPLGQTENTAVLEKPMRTVMPFLLRGFFMYIG